MVPRPLSLSLTFYFFEWHDVSQSVFPELCEVVTIISSSPHSHRSPSSKPHFTLLYLHGATPVRKRFKLLHVFQSQSDPVGSSSINGNQAGGSIVVRSMKGCRDFSLLGWGMGALCMTCRSSKVCLKRSVYSCAKRRCLGEAKPAALYS